MEFPTIDKFAKEVAEKALDEITYEGKTIKEWAEIIAKQQPCEDCISRETIINTLNYLCDCLCEYSKKQRATMCGACKLGIVIDKMEELPSVTPQPKVGKWILKHRKHNSMKWLTGTDEYGVEHTVKKYEEYECDEPYCSKCGKLAGDTSQNYCPNCGAKMEVEDGSD